MSCKPIRKRAASAPQLATSCAAIALHNIHAVGPIYRGGTQGEAENLASAYRYSLELASKHGIKSAEGIGLARQQGNLENMSS
nr:macro domain-containing protein [Chloroflexota bacterium]